MKRAATVGLAAAVVIAWAAMPASAQGRGGRGFGGFRAGPMLVFNEAVQEELQLSQEQRDAVAALGEEVRGQFQGGGDLSQEERAQRFQALREQIETGVAEILNEEQAARLEQIQLQQEGPSALAREDVAARVGLSAEQQQQVADISAQYQQRRRELFAQAQDADEETRREIFQQAGQLREEENAALLAVLSEEQQQTWNELLGDPFDLPRGGFGGPGGRGGRGPGGTPPGAARQ